MAGSHKMDVARKSSDGPAALLYLVPWDLLGQLLVRYTILVYWVTNWIRGI